MATERLLRTTLSAMLAASGCFALAHTVRAADAPTSQPAEHEEKEDKIAVDQLPAAVVDAVKTATPDGKITEAEKETRDHKVIYELDLTSGGKAYEVKVSEDGKILSQKIDDEKDEKDEKKN